MDRRAETDSCEGRRDQLGAGRTKGECGDLINLEVILLAFERPNDIDRWLFIVEWAFSKIAVLSRHLG